jgi:methionyl-tRNA formyltransferase
VHFLGTPEFAVPALNALHAHPRIALTCVVTQEDRPSGRGLALRTPPAGIAARGFTVPLYQPVSLKKIDWKSDPIISASEDESIQSYIEFLNAHPRPDFLVVVAYGKILPPDMLSYPLIDTLNVHPSLLPRWRGAAPLQRTLLAGDKKTGVCIMSLVPELDAGPVYSVQETEIDANETLASLHDRLSILGGKLLVETILEITDKRLTAVPQSKDGITYAEKWQKEESIIDWSAPAHEILNRIRACSPRPGARTLLEGKDFRILRAKIPEQNISPVPESWGILFPISTTGIGVSCGEHTVLELLEVQISGKKAMKVPEFLKGHPIKGEVSLRG